VCVCERGGGGVHHLQQLLFYIHCKLPSYVSNYTACIHNSNCLFALLRSLFHSLSLSLSLTHSLANTYTHAYMHKCRPSFVACRCCCCFAFLVFCFYFFFFCCCRCFVILCVLWIGFNVSIAFVFLCALPLPPQSTHCLLTTLYECVCVCLFSIRLDYIGVDVDVAACRLEVVCGLRNFFFFPLFFCSAVPQHLFPLPNIPLADDDDDISFFEFRFLPLLVYVCVCSLILSSSVIGRRQTRAALPTSTRRRILSQKSFFFVVNVVIEFGSVWLVNMDRCSCRCIDALLFTK